MGKHHTKEEDALLARMYNAGATIEELVEYFYRSDCSIKTRISNIRCGHIDAGVELTRKGWGPIGGRPQNIAVKVTETDEFRLKEGVEAPAPDMVVGKVEILMLGCLVGFLAGFLLGTS